MLHTHAPGVPQCRDKVSVFPRTYCVSRGLTAGDMMQSHTSAWSPWTAQWTSSRAATEADPVTALPHTSVQRKKPRWTVCRAVQAVFPKDGRPSI